MNRAGQFFGQNRMDQALACDPILAVELQRGNFYAKMAFALRMPMGMAGMKVRFVDNLQPARRESRDQLGAQPVDDARRIRG